MVKLNLIPSSFHRMQFEIGATEQVRRRCHYHHSWDDSIQKRKSYDLLDSGFYYTVQYLVPLHNRGKTCKCKYCNEYSDENPIENRWYKEVALVTSLHVKYILLCFHHTNDTNSKCLYKKYYTYLIHMDFNVIINVSLC